jgi:hypothetical protein
MDVVLHVVRSIILHDKLELLHVESSSCDGRGDDDGNDSTLEVGDGLISIDLLHTAVQRHARVVLPQQVGEELVRTVLSLDEDERASVGVLVGEVSEELEKSVEFVVFRSNFDDLVDFWRDDGATSDGDLERTTEDLAGESLHLTRERGGEEDGLAVGSDLVENLHHLHAQAGQYSFTDADGRETHLRLESHVKHTIGFVENEVGDTLQVDDTS